MADDLDADLIIIGSGAGGGTLARALAPSGISILVLERGEFLRREKANWQAEAVFHDHRYHTHEHWRDGTGRLFQPVTGYHVGGNTKLYGAAVLRRRREDFVARKHVDGSTPDWPISYAALSSHYDEAERWYYAHGLAGSDPTEPPRGEYPYPPFTHEPYIAEVARQLKTLGLHPFPLPLALNRDEAQPQQSACIRCNSCDGFPCLVHAKGDAETCGIRPALQHANVRILPGVRVEKLLTNDAGSRVESVETLGPDGAHRFRARVVVVAAGAINSAALLLASANARHPRGLANGSDQLGRNYMCHVNSACIAINPRRINPTVFQKTIAINDFYNSSGEADFPYPLGHIQNLGKVTPAILKAQRPALPWPLAQWAANHSLDWWLTTEDLPRPDNRVSLDADGTIRVHYKPTNEVAHRRLVAGWKNILKRLGYPLVFTQRMGIEAVAHQVGTARFGTDPGTSVLDLHCKAHELDNLYVVDASFMPSIAAVNPSLTIMANALRVGAHLRQRFAQGDWHIQAENG
ncbi:MAG: GMC family oxidoreductase [Sulfuriferula sp.]